jgi:hypothetical protein
MWVSVIVFVLIAVSALTYWWLGHVWPETRELQKQIRDDRRQAREAVLRRPEGREPH